MLVPLFLLTLGGPSPAPAAEYSAHKDPPIRVWFNRDGNYASGDRAKVYAKSAQDGYLIVLRSDAGGRVRVLFPLDPNGEQRISGGKKYELKGRGGREAFIADDSSGHGTVLAAVSKSPFRVDEFVANGRWNTQALSARGAQEDPEDNLIQLVHRMKAADQTLEFSVATYVVSEQYAREMYGYPYGRLGWTYDPWWGYGPRVGGFWYGPRYRYGYPRRGPYR